jgi:hypothetical protein
MLHLWAADILTHALHPRYFSPEGETFKFIQTFHKIEAKTPVKIEIQIGEDTLAIEMRENQTIDALVKMLPLTLKMNDIHGRVKYSSLKKSLPVEDGEPQDYDVGDLLYWPGGPGLLIPYRQGAIGEFQYRSVVLGTIKGSLVPISLPSPIELTLESLD